MPVAVDNPILRAALEYAELGLRVIPLYGILEGRCECVRGAECASAGKHPRVSAWQKEASADEDKIIGWFERWPNSNVGVALGPMSGIIDIECDSPEAEQTLAAMCGGEFPDTPTYQSRRGKHRLFRYQDELPFPEKAAWKIGAIDIKTGMGAKGTQSVFPPSKRADGGSYDWIVRPDCGFAPLPELLHAELWNRSSGEGGPDKSGNRHRENLYTQPVIPEGSRDDTIYAEAVALWGEKLRLYGERCLDDADIIARVNEMLNAWDVAKCRPALGQEVVRQKSESARGFIRGRAKAGKATAGIRFTKYGLELKEGEWWPGSWKVVIFGADPIEYHLIVPDWKELIGGDGRIRMNASQYLAAGDVAKAIAVSTQCIVVDDVPGVWPAIWNGAKGSKKEERPATRGLKAKLLDIADREVAPPEMRADAKLAEIVSEIFRKAKPFHESDALAGRPARMDDGSIVFKTLPMFSMIREVWRDIEYRPLVDLLLRLELLPLKKRVGERVFTLKVAGKKSLDILHMIETGECSRSTYIGGK